MSDVTRLLSAIDQGDPHAAARLLPLVYDELRKLATQKLAHEQPGQTLQATALVHEAYLRLVDTDTGQHWNSRGHFFAAAAEAMCRILVDNARRKKRAKRGGGLRRADLADHPAPASDDRLLALDDALKKLGGEDPVAARVVELRHFAGLGHEQIAGVLGITVYQARQKWTYAGFAQKRHFGSWEGQKTVPTSHVNLPSLNPDTEFLCKATYARAWLRDALGD
jgi:RNA polymerase sigma factor (TIGR02999 family)